jgi:hypothetical protein
MFIIIIVLGRTLLLWCLHIVNVSKVTGTKVMPLDWKWVLEIGVVGMQTEIREIKTNFCVVSWRNVLHNVDFTSTFCNKFPAYRQLATRLVRDK